MRTFSQTIYTMMASVMLIAPAMAQDVPAPATIPAPVLPDGPRPTKALGAGPWGFDTQTGRIKVEVVTRQLDHPWAIAFLPDGTILVTERPGRLRIIRDGVLDPVPIAGLPPINPLSIGGLYDIALDPDFAGNHRIFLSYVKPDSQDHNQTTLAVMSATYRGGMALADVKDVFVADAWYGAMPWPERCCGQGPGFGSWGGRIAFGADGKLYVAVGDRNYGEMVQQTDNDFGKILRINADGSIPPDNPFVGRPGWNAQIWTLGHRNPLGLIVNAATGELWETEFGPRGGDELNLIERGQNYGWIDVTQGQHYDNTPASGVKNVPGMTDPMLAFGPPSLNPGDPVWYDEAMFPQWRSNLLVPTFNNGLLRIMFDADGHAAGTEELIAELGQRLRDVDIASDGSLYVVTDEVQGSVLRISGVD